LVTIDADTLKRFGTIAIQLRPVKTISKPGAGKMVYGIDSTGVIHETGNKWVCVTELSSSAYRTRLSMGTK
jgi:hypothetical protein